MISTLKKLNKKGFTLAELLIVVAIIAILVAIAIPVFSSSLTKAKQSVDDANIRAAYAQYTVDKLQAAANGGTDVSATQASASDALAAFNAIDVTSLKYYTGISVPKDGGRWVGTGDTGAGVATLATASFDIET